jgi:hypothetical protein
MARHIQGVLLSPTLLVVLATSGLPSTAKPLSPREARALEGKEVTVEAKMRIVGRYTEGKKLRHFFLANADSPGTFKPVRLDNPEAGDKIR